MEQKKELVCIRCPLGCRLLVDVEKDGTLSVSGNGCMRGEEYAKKELTAPTRMVTTTVRVKNGNRPVVPVKTAGDIPKEKIMDCIARLKEIELKAPVRQGAVVVQNIEGTGVDIITTGAVLRIESGKGVA